MLECLFEQDTESKTQNLGGFKSSEKLLGEETNSWKFMWFPLHESENFDATPEIIETFLTLLDVKFGVVKVNRVINTLALNEDMKYFVSLSPLE